MPPTVLCDRVCHKMAEFSFARCVFTVCMCHSFGGLESQLEVSESIHAFFVFLSFSKMNLYWSISSETYIFSCLNCDSPDLSSFTAKICLTFLF